MSHSLELKPTMPTPCVGARPSAIMARAAARTWATYSAQVKDRQLPPSSQASASLALSSSRSTSAPTVSGARDATPAALRPRCRATPPSLVKATFGVSVL